MTPEQLTAIKERAAKATPGPWEVCNGTDVFTELGAKNREGLTANPNDGWYIAKANEGSTSVGDEDVEMSFFEQNANAKFIANARQDIPALVAEVDRLASKLSEAVSLLSEAHDVLDDVHCYETETYIAITKYLNGED